jgi:hypothetical protein
VRKVEIVVFGWDDDLAITLSQVHQLIVTFIEPLWSISTV